MLSHMYQVYEMLSQLYPMLSHLYQMLSSINQVYHMLSSLYQMLSHLYHMLSHLYRRLIVMLVVIDRTLWDLSHLSSSSSISLALVSLSRVDGCSSMSSTTGPLATSFELRLRFRDMLRVNVRPASEFWAWWLGRQAITAAWLFRRQSMPFPSRFSWNSTTPVDNNTILYSKLDECYWFFSISILYNANKVTNQHIIVTFHLIDKWLKHSSALAVSLIIWIYYY